MAVLPLLVPLLKPLTILVGPAPLFYLYRLWQSTPSTVSRTRRSLPPQSAFAITILLITSFFYIFILLLGGSENVFHLTQSRFVTQASVLQSRLSKFRNVSENDQILFERLATSLSDRINFAKFGPSALIHCTWCETPHIDPTNGTPITLGDPTKYLLFSLPQIMAPYLLHAFLIGIITTPFLSLSQTCRDLRVYISYALGLVLAAELSILATFDGTGNSSAHELRDVIWLHWDLHFLRYAALAVISIGHAVVIYVIETAWVVLRPTEAERLLQVSMMGENVAQRMRLAKTVREVVMKKGTWRQRAEKWWEKQRVSSGDVPEIPEEVKLRWEEEARSWVDAKIKFD